MSSKVGDKRKGRKKNFYQSFTKKSKHGKLTCGLRGFLISSNNRDYQCLQAAYSLLNKYADKIYPSNEEQIISKDLEESLAQELEAVKKERFRFNKVGTNCRNVLFIRAEDCIDPRQVMKGILVGIEEKEQLQVNPIIKMYPISATCNAYVDEMTKTFRKLLDEQEIEETTYYILPRIRNNSSITKEQLIIHLAEVVFDVKNKWTADFGNPKLVIGVDIVNTICCFSIMEDFNRYKKYNLDELISSIAKVESLSAGDTSKTESTSEKKIESSDEANDAQTSELEPSSTLEPEDKKE